MTENLAFIEIYNKYKNLVMKVAHTIVNDLGTAEDIMQETFLALYNDMEAKGLESEEGYTNIKSWLFTTAKHKALNYCKKSGRVIAADMVEGMDAIEEPVTPSLESKYLETVEEEMREELHVRIFTALMEKNPRWHDAIMLVCYMNIPTEEAARRLHISENALYVMIHRARKWIHKNFDAEYEEMDRF